MKKILAYTVTYLAALTIFTQTLLLAETLERPLVKIGLIYPLTGAMSSFGEDMARALPLFEKRFNSLQSKYQFKLIMEDGKFGLGNAAITAAKKLVHRDQVKLLVVGSSGEVLQIAPFVESSHVVTVAGFASHPDVRAAGDYIFRTYVDIDKGLPPLIEDIQSKKFSRIAIITELSSFTKAIKDSLQNKLGSAVVFSEEYPLDEADLKTLVTKARQNNPQAYYLNTTTPSNFILLFKTLRESGITAPFYTFYVPSIKEVQEQLGTALNGTSYLDFPEITRPSPEFVEFLATLTETTGTPVKAPFNFKTNYNALTVLFDAVMAVGPDSTQVKNYLYHYDSPSATGRLRFDDKGDVVDLNLTLKTFSTW